MSVEKISGEAVARLLDAYKGALDEPSVIKAVDDALDSESPGALAYCLGYVRGFLHASGRFTVAELARHVVEAEAACTHHERARN